MVFQSTMFLFLLQSLVMIPRLALSVHHSNYPHHHSLDTDKAALLEFKRTITSDPNSSLSNWNDSTHVCHFNGVRCNKEHHRVRRLNLNEFGLVGPLSPFISNLTHLRVLELVNNHLSGEIPWDLSSLRHLHHLLLEGNDLHGQIPDIFSLLLNLTVVDLRLNRLTGTIPHSFFSNCTLLKNVDLSFNFIQGNIPEIGNCKDLWNLNLYNNKFTGGIPFSITNASSMVNLDVEYNYLSGELPSKIVASLPYLEYLHLSFNALSSPENNYNLDPFFTALCNYTSLKELELEGMELVGELPTSIGNCVSLSSLLLQENNITGSLPRTVLNLTFLLQLNLTSNLLSGTIPDEISQLPLLQQLLLSHNSFDGPIPAALGMFRRIGLLDLSNNKFSGEIPKSLGNLTQISYLFLNNNLLSGSIPSSLGQCGDLYKLDLSYNRLTGNIPPEISSLREIRIILNLSHNFLGGDLPVELSELENVQEMDLSSNRFTGRISPWISSCISLSRLNLSHNLLVGELPESLGDLKNLEVFDVSVNQLFGAIPTSLSNIRTLTFISLSHNFLDGDLPVELSELENVQEMDLSSNRFTGHISHRISSCIALSLLNLSHNLLVGELPESLGDLKNLEVFDLSNNRFSGEIPKSLGNLTQISSLFLDNNLLSGSIPSSFGQCRDLYKLDLSYNRLTGKIPREISGLREIRIFLNLSHNFLEGDLPVELSELENVQEMDLSSNRFTGRISHRISSCTALSLLNLSHNLLEGELPEFLGDLNNLKAFDVSANQLSGTIPTSLSNIRTLTFLNLSVNHFSGTIPSGGIFDSVTSLSFLPNGNLCGSIPGIPICQERKRLFQSTTLLVIFWIVISSSVVCFMIGCRYSKVIISAGKAKSETETETESQPEWIHNFPRITYKELFDATGGFDEQRKLGSGSSRRVYKGVLPDGMHIAVKVLQFQTGNPTKSFYRECRVLKRIRHRNLIRIITACSLPDFKALVLPYMTNGSLESWLYPHSVTGLSTSGSSDLTLIQRVNICRDIAEGMAYLHHHSPVRVIHCDLKPSNVLLNDHMTALVSDFGISRLVMTFEGGNNRGFENMGKSTTNMLCGSIGYIAPEYGFGSNMSIKRDVYSFGILVLEMVTRKRPTDNMFSGGLSLPIWVESHYHGQMERVVDSTLVKAMRDQSPEVKKKWEVAIRELTELGILCAQQSPSTRPTMLDANNYLDRLKRYLMGDTTATFASSLGISSSTVGED